VTQAGNAKNTILPVVPKSGIYFENVGRAKLTNSIWNLITFRDMDLYKQRHDFLTHCMKTVDDLCNQIQVKNHSQTYDCEQRLTLVKIYKSKMEEGYENIQHLAHHSLARKKRFLDYGLFPQLSTITKWLMGTPDSADHRRYDTAIDQVLGDTENIRELMKEQFHIIKSGILDFNSTLTTLMQNEAVLNSNFRSIQNFMEQTEQILNKTALKQLFIENEVILTSMLQGTVEEYDTLTAGILFGKKGILHPSIISPLELSRELGSVQLPSDKTFPFAVDPHSIHRFIDLCKIDMAFTDKNRLVFTIRIPLAQNQDFDLYKILPFPVSTSEPLVHHFIQPSADYFLVNRVRTKRALLKDLTTCVELSEGNFLCHLTILEYTNPENSCETTLFLNKSTEIPLNCEVKTIYSEMAVYYPLLGNKWLFSLTKAETISVECATKEKIQDLYASGVGLLFLEDNCRAYMSNGLIMSFTRYTHTYTHYGPWVNIGLNTSLEPLNFTRMKLQPVKVTDLNSKELKVLAHKIEDYEKILDLRSGHERLQDKTSWLGYTAGFALLGVGAYWIFKCYPLVSWSLVTCLPFCSGTPQAQSPSTFLEHAQELLHLNVRDPPRIDDQSESSHAQSDSVTDSVQSRPQARYLQRNRTPKFSVKFA
jgi:hypothetical protein